MVKLIIAVTRLATVIIISNTCSPPFDDIIISLRCVKVNSFFNIFNFFISISNSWECFFVGEKYDYKYKKRKI